MNYLSRQSLTETAAEYRRQQTASLADANRADAAAIAIEHLLRVSFPDTPDVPEQPRPALALAATEPEPAPCGA